MTKRQKKLYDYLIRYISENDIAPNYVEMMEYMGLSKKSKSVIHQFLKELEKEGLITRIPGKWRGIKINERRNTTTIR